MYRHRSGAGYPRIIGGHYYPGTGIYGYVAGAAAPGLASAQSIIDQVLAAQGVLPGHPAAMVPVQHTMPGPAIVQPPWRPMVAPGTPPTGEGHEPVPLTPTTFNGTWGGAAGAPAGTVILFMAQPQHPFKVTRWIVRGTKSGATAIGNLIGQVFVGTDLQQGQLGFIDLETLGAGGSFDTWVSAKQAEPGVFIQVQATLTAFPTPPDFETYTVSALGHYFH